MHLQYYADNKSKARTAKRSAKVNDQTKNQYRIANASEMTPEELIKALRDKIQQIL